MMAECLYCNKKSIFLSVSKRGLCNKCEPPVLNAINRHLEIIQESADLVDNSKVFKTRMGRVNDIINNLVALRDGYSIKGIDVGFDPNEKIDVFEEIRSNIINEEAHLKTQDFLQKASLAKTLNSKINNANKTILFLKSLEDDYGYSNKELGSRVFKFIHDAEYTDLLTKAEKEEFKGNNKKAIDRYQDVLFFLKKDEIDDSEQRTDINYIENKINSLK